MLEGIVHSITKFRSASPKRKNNISQGDKSSYKEDVEESTMDKNKIINHLQNELLMKESLIQSLNAKVERLEDNLINFTKINQAAASVEIQRRTHKVSPNTYVIHDKGKIIQSKMGTRGSILTANALSAIPEREKNEIYSIAQKFIKVFQNPEGYLAYIKSEQFASELITLCEELEAMLEDEPRCLFMQSPVYVFGDIHGNLEDLHFFADNIWKLGMELTAGKFLFLGDYVDRGSNCLECVAYLFALKILYPGKINLLRGNHETRDVNGWEEHYAEKSFLYQCKDRFGVDLGNLVWEECNQVFDRLPFAAVIDHEIFCIHGGIPRLVEGFDNEVQSILALPNISAVMPCYEHETELTKQISADCIWSDPAPESMEPMLDASGFGPSPRGGGAMCFGLKAIDNFLANNNLSYIIRAHEAHAHGVSLSKGARVFTVFSTSKDHRQGSRAMAGCMLIDTDTIQVINRSPKYKNKYVHRRTSISLDLTEEEIEDRMRLGLIRASIADMEELNRLRMEEEAEERAKYGDDNSDAKSETYVPGF